MAVCVWGGGTGECGAGGQGGGGLANKSVLQLVFPSGLPPSTLSPRMSFPTRGKTVPRHPPRDGCQVTVPHHPYGNRTTAVYAPCGAQKLRQKTK